MFAGSCSDLRINNDNKKIETYNSLVKPISLENQILIYDDINIIQLNENQFGVSNFAEIEGSYFTINLKSSLSSLAVLINPKITMVINKKIYYGRGIPSYSSLNKAPLCHFNYVIGCHIKLNEDSLLLCRYNNFISVSEFITKHF
jgi:hypothetical protein